MVNDILDGKHDGRNMAEGRPMEEVKAEIPMCKECNDLPAMVRKDTGNPVNGLCGMCAAKKRQETIKLKESKDPSFPQPIPKQEPSISKSAILL